MVFVVSVIVDLNLWVAFMDDPYTGARTELSSVTHWMSVMNNFRLKNLRYWARHARNNSFSQEVINIRS